MTAHIPTVLIVDDEIAVARSLQRALEKKNPHTLFILAHDKETALQAVREQAPSIIILDLTIEISAGPESGLSLLDKIIQHDRLCRIIVLTGHSKHEYGIEALQRGAFTYIEKPANIDIVHAFIQDGLTVVELKRAHHKNQNGHPVISHELAIHSQSSAMRTVLPQIEFAAQTNQPLLITGETGTGKGVLARLIHSQSARKKFPFIRYQPSFTNADLVASELFGHKKGAFTGAIEDKKGLIEEAHNGTLFIDEIDSLPKETQVSLLETLQEKTFRKLGTSREQKSDFRLIAALNKDPKKLIKEGILREDFYHRIAHCIIDLPALRDRSEDFELLSQNCLDTICDREKLQIAFIEPTAIRKLKKHTWPGNLRELHATIEGAAYKAAIQKRSYISKEDLPDYTTDEDSISLSHMSFRERIQQYEEHIVLQALHEAKGNQALAAKNLQMDRTVFRRILLRKNNTN